jgi:hypothetical protein
MVRPQPVVILTRHPGEALPNLAATLSTKRTNEREKNELGALYNRQISPHLEVHVEVDCIHAGTVGFSREVSTTDVTITVESPPRIFFKDGRID